MRIASRLLSAFTMAGIPFSFAHAQDQAFQSQVQALEWRAIGPFNGGRGSTVVGHPTDEHVFFFGHSSGGLWKTDDAGAYWTPVGEGQFRYASVGAIAIYEQNPDIMYVGLGEPNLRQSVSWGDGMYKSLGRGDLDPHRTSGGPPDRQSAHPPRRS
jgi:photosystem II stability/assembly factor-like uncharacterized protein